MKMITAELTGKPLDWALAVAMGYAQINTHVSGKVFATMPDGGREQVDHTDPATCMGLMNEYKMDVTWGVSGKCYMQPSGNIDFSWWVGGATLAEAVARCVVAMRLGDEVDVPDELCGVVG